ncbi:MAG TPA: hypothetical protein VGE27_14205, partial [Gemmatimonas sp.]|uniref:hypothetical protein n=1 Tax=Gemmatimonas sp. TaxID=1962908 RepID=UPI002ED94E96
DLVVVRGPSAVVDGRPSYMAMGGRRTPTPIAVPECATQHCFVVAHRAGEPGTATVLDRVEANRRQAVTLYLPNEAARITVFAASGQVLRATNPATPSR